MSKKSDILLGIAVQFSPFAFAVWQAMQAETLLSAPVAPCVVPSQARHLVDLLRAIASQATTVQEILDVADELEASIEPLWSGAGSRPYACSKDCNPKDSLTNDMDHSTTMTDFRYPNTYACDYIRGFGPVQYGEGVILSRADASQIRQGIAKALDMDDHQLACKLADAFLQQQDDPEHQERQEKRLLATLGISPTSLTH